DGRTFISSPVPVGDPTTVEVIGAELDFDLVAGEDSDVMLPHLPGDGREHGMATFVELHPEHRARERFDDLAFNLDLLFLSRHSLQSIGVPDVQPRTAEPRAKAIIVAKRLLSLAAPTPPRSGRWEPAALPPILPALSARAGPPR